MKISDILSKNKVNISCELFPPKEGSVLEKAEALVRDTAALSPEYISVTCGAAGGNRDKTIAIADLIKNNCGVEALAHLTCIAATKESVGKTLAELKAKNVENILALRGDIIGDAPSQTPGEFAHASDLASYIADFGGFCIGGACYPEGHPEAGSVDKDIENLKYKLDAGVSFLVTQLFFDNDILYNYLFRLMRAGITVPVTAGIMPLTSAKQVKRMTSISGNQLPQKLRAIIERFGDDPASMQQAGIAYASSQIIELIANGITNIHVYTMNNPVTAKKILDNFSEIRKGGEV